MTSARAAARTRHPSSIWRADHDRLRQRLTTELAEGGHPQPVLAATLLSIRGRLGLDRAAFCEITGVDALAVAAVEDGLGEDPALRRRTL